MLHQWISGILGLVVSVVPFLKLSETTFTWLLVIVGLAITVSSFGSMLAEANANHSAQSTRRNV